MLQQFNKIISKETWRQDYKIEDEIIPCNQEAVYLQEDDELD